MKSLRCIALSTALLLILPAAVIRGGKAEQEPSGKASSWSPQELFRLLSHSVVIVESLDTEGAVVVQGSGVAVASDRVVTNSHVIEGAASVRVRQSGKTWPAIITHIDADHDLSRLKVEGLEAPPVAMRPSSSLQMGERVYAIGAPAGLELTLSEGLVSGLRRYGEVYVIQTTAPVSHGSSGGGLFDSRGQLIGITTFILKEGQNLNFAMPTEWVQALEKHLVQQEHAARSSGVGFEALTWWQLGIKAFQAGDYKQAVRAFESALRYDPENPYLWTDLGAMYGRQGHYEDAVRSHRTAIELKSDHNVIWSNLCGAYTGLQKYRQALEACREGMRLEKNDYMLWYNYGGALLGSKLFVQAEIAYKKSVDLRPDYASAWINLGTVYSEMGTIWHSQAIQAYQEGLRLEPDNATGWYNLGLVYHELGDRSRVLRVYQRLKSLDRGMADKFFRQVVLP